MRCDHYTMRELEVLPPAFPADLRAALVGTMEALDPREVREALAQRVFDESNGNPSRVRALVSTLTDSGALTLNERGLWGFGQGVAQTVAHPSSPEPTKARRRWIYLAAAAIVYLAALRWPVTNSWPWLGAHLAVVLVGFPVILALAGFFRPAEKALLRSLLPSSA